MIESRQRFRDKIDNVKQVLTEHLDYARQVTDRLAVHLDMKNEMQDLEQLHANLVKGRFEIIVVGEFSTGKSTFINALIGRKVLPSKAQPTTATVNYIRHYSENPNRSEEAVVFFEDGRSERVPFDQLEQYVTEMSTKFSVVEEIKHVDLYVDSAYLEDGVVIVDTPGMQSLHKKHDEITRKQIAVSNASIFLFNINHAATRTEFIFISDIQKSLDRIFFVANRCDEVDTSEQSVESVVLSIEDKLKRNDYFQVDPKFSSVYAVSAAKALQKRIGGVFATGKDEHDASRFWAFEEKLWVYLTQGEKAREMLVQPLHRMEGFYQNLLASMQENIQLLNGELNLDEIREKVEQLRQQIDTRRMALNDEKERLYLQLKDLKDCFRKEYEAEVDGVGRVLKRESEIHHLEDYEEHREQILGHIRSAYNDCIRKMTDRFKDRLAGLVVKYADRFDEELSDKLGTWNGQAGLDVTLRAFKARGNAELEKLNQEKEEIRQEIGHAQSQQDRQVKAITDDHYNRQLENLRQREEQIYQHRLQMIKHQFDAEPLTMEKSERREREGLFGKMKDMLSGREEIKVTVKNPDRAALAEAMKQLEDRFEAAMKELDGRKRVPGVSPEEAKRRLDAAEAKEQQLKEQYNNVRGEIMKKTLEVNERLLGQVKDEILHVVASAGHQAKRAYDGVIADLQAERMMNHAFDLHIRQHDQEIVAMDARIKEHEMLVQQNRQKQEELLALLDGLHQELNVKTKEIRQLYVELIS
ncbi:dynamin family protein [Paenibacillus pinistramenti]|uniref:dynamin family protein n=1 Tax=Paenibacillus pinistramenti TaxID=1768003 RepID=UPI001396BDC1|nr:dynamin family protein [Paenibacillus pinistramenti]